MATDNLIRPFYCTDVNNPARLKPDIGSSSVRKFNITKGQVIYGHSYQTLERMFNKIVVG